MDWIDRIEQGLNEPNFKAGWFAFRRGQPRDSNPHTYGHGSYNGWDQGWMEALYDQWKR